MGHGGADDGGRRGEFGEPVIVAGRGGGTGQRAVGGCLGRRGMAGGEWLGGGRRSSGVGSALGSRLSALGSRLSALGSRSDSVRCSAFAVEAARRRKRSGAKARERSRCCAHDLGTLARNSYACSDGGRGRDMRVIHRARHANDMQTTCKRQASDKRATSERNERHATGRDVASRERRRACAWCADTRIAGARACVAHT